MCICVYYCYFFCLFQLLVEMFCGILVLIVNYVDQCLIDVIFWKKVVKRMNCELIIYYCLLDRCLNIKFVEF